MHLRQADLEARGGPGAGTVRNIEQASRESYAQRTFVQLETALLWPDGVVEKILDGTAEPNEIAEIVDRGVIHAKSGGGVGIVTGSGRADLGFAAHAQGQVIRPDSVPYETRVGEPVVHVGNLTPQERAEQLAHLETLDDDRAIFELANRLVPILARRSAAEKGSLGPAARTAVTALLDVMKELVDPLYGDRKDEE